MCEMGNKLMPLFSWSDKFSVQIRKTDKQHKRLIDLINSLHETKSAQNNSALMDKILDGLIYYTKIHFKKEEELMSMYGFPAYETHKSEHDGLAQEVNILREKYYTGDGYITTEMAILLNDWLAEHVLVEDKKLPPFC